MFICKHLLKPLFNFESYMVNVCLKSGIFKRKMGRVMILDVLWTFLLRRKIIDS